jgi:hypothetical protein
MQFVSEIKKLCTPAFVYLVIAVLGLITIMLQNVGNENKLCVGRVECSVSTTAGTFLVKALWIMFWTYILSTLCKYGHSNIAWFLVLLPFIIMLIALVYMADMITGSNRAIAETATDAILVQQHRDDATMNLRVQQGYFESGAHSGVKVYQL